MAGLKRFSYVNKDHESIVSDCVLRIKERYGDKWNDFEEDSAGMMMLQAFSYITDILLFYLDRQANETYLPTATERQNLINMCKLIGYRPAPAQAAQVDLRFTLDRQHTQDTVIPAQFQVATSEGVIFETQADATIRAGETAVTVSALEGETFNEQIGTSNGDLNQEFYLPRSGVIQLAELYVDSRAWAVADSTADRLAHEAVYMADMDAWGRVRISFGNGKNGRVPEAGAKIRAVYRVGGGTGGNVTSNTITTMRSSVADIVGERVKVSATNPAPAAGGTDAESVERIKQWAPRSYEAQNRCVTQTDYETIAMTFRDPEAGAIAKARAVVKERTGEANVIKYYILAYSGSGGVAVAPQGLKDKLLAYINERKMLTDWIEIQDGTWRTVDIEGSVRAAGGVNSEKLMQSIHRSLIDLFNVDTMQMGESVRISDVYAAIDNVEGVLHVELTSPTATVAASNNELLLLGNVTLSVEVGGGESGTNQ